MDSSANRPKISDFFKMKEIILAALIHNADKIILSSSRVGKDRIELLQNQRRLISPCCRCTPQNALSVVSWLIQGSYLANNLKLHWPPLSRNRTLPGRSPSKYTFTSGPCQCGFPTTHDAPPTETEHHPLKPVTWIQVRPRPAADTDTSGSQRTSCQSRPACRGRRRRQRWSRDTSGEVKGSAYPG